DDAAAGGRRELGVVGGASAAVGHFHAARFGVGARSASLCAVAGLAGFAARRDRADVLERFFEAFGFFASRAKLSRAATSLEFAGVLFDFGLEGLQMVGGVFEVLLERGLAAKRTGSGAGANAHAVLGDRVDVDEALARQAGERLRQDLIEQRPV